MPVPRKDDNGGPMNQKQLIVFVIVGGLVALGIIGYILMRIPGG